MCREKLGFALECCDGWLYHRVWGDSSAGAEVEAWVWWQLAENTQGSAPALQPQCHHREVLQCRVATRAGYFLTLHASCWVSTHHLWHAQCLWYSPLHSCALSPACASSLVYLFPLSRSSSHCAYCTPSLMFLCIYPIPSLLPLPVNSHLPGCGPETCNFLLISTLTLVVGSRQEIAFPNNQITPVNNGNRDCEGCIAKWCGHTLESHQLVSEIPVPIAIISQGLQCLWK